MKEIIEERSHNGWEIQEGGLIINVWHVSSPEKEKEAARKIEKEMNVHGFLSGEV